MPIYNCFVCHIKFQPIWKVDKREGTLCDDHRSKDNDDRCKFFDCLSCKLRIYIEDKKIPEEYLIGERAYCLSCKPRFVIRNNDNYNSTCSWCLAPCFKSPNYKGKEQKCNVCKKATCSRCPPFNNERRQCSNCNPKCENNNDPNCCLCKDPTVAIYFGEFNWSRTNCSRLYLCFCCHYDEFED